MKDEQLLMLPGPVPMPERVRLAMARQAINHRGEEFGEIYADTVRMLRPLFNTSGEILVLSGSGTAAMEAAVANFGRGATIAALSNGKFGERLCEIAAIYGEAVPVTSGWGEPLDIGALESALEEGAEVVTMVHNETSAGIKNPAEEVGRIARRHDALFIMDGVTSVGGDLVEVDRWGVDVAIVGSQKCLAAPPGLSAVAVSDRAWDRLADLRPYYLDLAAYRKSARKDPPQTPYTPAVPLYIALREALAIIEREGIEERIARHRRMAGAVRAAVDAWGCTLFPVIDDLHEYSNTVTAIRLPDGVDWTSFRSAVRMMGIEIAGGQEELKGQIFRIGHMGAVGAPEILATLAAVQSALGRCGADLEGDGVAAAAEVLG
ncbi:MAG: pyridoxal-phosphate-dependent aminotransferase family protein [Methanoculleaceae archaeon]